MRNGLNGYRIAYLYSLASRDITAILFLEKRVLTGLKTGSNQFENWINRVLTGFQILT